MVRLILKANWNKPRCRCCAQSAAAKCASSPSSSTRQPCARSLSTSANPPRHRASRRPAARRFRTCPLPEQAVATLAPTRHRSTSSINASFGNPTVDRRLRATPGRRVPVAAGTRGELPHARARPAPGPLRAPQRPLITPASRRSGQVETCYVAAGVATGALDLLGAASRAASLGGCKSLCRQLLDSDG